MMRTIHSVRGKKGASTMEIKGIDSGDVDVKPTVLSTDAIIAWKDVLSQLFIEVPKLQQVIVPVVIYTPGKHSDDGAREYGDPLNVDADDIKNEWVENFLQQYLEQEDIQTHDIALNRNVMLVEFAKPPRLVTLDIWDINPNGSFDPQMFSKYNVLKTKNAFHAYRKENVFDIVGGNAHYFKDPDWATGFIRVTESAEKGAITKHGNP